MGQLILGNISRFIFFTLLQIAVIQYVNFGSWCNPQLYLISVLLLPFETPRMIVLLICFVQGIVIDLFYDQQGLHSGAMVLLGFLRPYVLNFIAPREGYDALMKPSSYHMGNFWFLTYASILVFAHHVFYFYIEIFRFSEFFSTLLRAFVSCLATVVLIFLFQFLFHRKDRSQT
jgi:cell shape-determining protein MreD